jgi:hypothetical protein
MNGCMHDGWMDGWVVGWMDKWMGGWMDGVRKKWITRSFISS